MSILANLTQEQVKFIRKLVRHKDRGLLSVKDCVEAIVSDHSITPSAAETILDEVKTSSSSLGAA